jgi:hypothetical protein
VSPNEDESESARRKRKRKSRWGAEDISEKLFIPGMPTVLPANLSKEQEEAYLRKCPFQVSIKLFNTFSLFFYRADGKRPPLRSDLPMVTAVSVF